MGGALVRLLHPIRRVSVTLKARFGRVDDHQTNLDVTASVSRPPEFNRSLITPSDSNLQQ